MSAATGPDASIIALFPVEDTRRGHIYAPASPLAADTTYEVVTRLCPHCVCEGCALAQGATEIVAVVTRRDHSVLVLGRDDTARPRCLHQGRRGAVAGTDHDQNLRLYCSQHQVVGTQLLRHPGNFFCIS